MTRSWGMLAPFSANSSTDGTGHCLWAPFTHTTEPSKRFQSVRSRSIETTDHCCFVACRSIQIFSGNTEKRNTASCCELNVVLPVLIATSVGSVIALGLRPDSKMTNVSDDVFVCSHRSRWCALGQNVNHVARCPEKSAERSERDRIQSNASAFDEATGRCNTLIDPM